MAPTTATSRVLRTRDVTGPTQSHHPQHDATPQTRSGLASLARKLRHPLGRIRARALENLLFKLREGLVDVASEPVYAVDETAGALVACLAENELETAAIQVFQLLLMDDQSTRVCAPSLRKHGAAAALQRGTVQPVRADLQATYDALLHRLLATTTAAQEVPLIPMLSGPQPHEMATADAAAVAESASLNSRVSPSVQVAQATVAARRASVHANTNSKHRDPLTSGGWRFPHVALAAVDEQFLFEFEVKWRLRTTIPEIVDMCDSLRRELLRDFPPEVFLQRPAVISRVLELVQQPIVPAATTPELSFGVNYFDEPASPSFAWKPSVQATALHVSSLKTIESWLAALRHASETSLNPAYHTFQSSAESSPAHIVINSGYDHRRLYYPRVEVGDDAQSQTVEGDDGFSLSGAAYLLIATLMRLLPSSTTYPRLHLLNLIHAATDFLPERSITSHDSNHGAQLLDKQRLVKLFAILADIQARGGSGEKEDEETLVKERALEWFVRVLQLFQPSAYVVEGRCRSGNIDGIVAVVIPASLWHWMLEALASSDTKSTSSLVDILAEIESSAKKTIQDFRKSRDDAREVDAVLFADDATDGDLHPPVLPQIALRVLLTVSHLSEDKRRNVNRVVLRTICHELETRNEVQRRVGDGTSQLTNRILLQTLKLATEEVSPQCREVGLSILDQVVDWIVSEGSSSTTNNRLLAFIDAVAVSEVFMETLLCALAASPAGEDDALGTLWRLAEVTLQGIVDATLHDSKRSRCNVALSSSCAILQHFAYADSNFLGESSESHRRLQRTFVRLVHQLEEDLSTCDQLLLVSRCLIHRSAYIRKAAASGLFEKLSRQIPANESMNSAQSLVAADPFGQYVGGATSETQRRVLEDEFPSLLQPLLSSSNGVTGEDTGSTTNHAGSSVLHRVSRLRKLVSTLSVNEDADVSTSSAVMSTLEQLLIDVAQASSVDFTVLHEAGEVDELIMLLLGILRRVKGSGISWSRPARGSLVALIRVILMRSPSWRRKIQEEAQTLSLLLAFAFDEDPRVRAEIFFLVLALTCSVESVLPTILRFAKPTLEVPAEFSKSFGLFASRWSSSGIAVRPLLDIVHELGSPRDDFPAFLDDGSIFESGATQSLDAFQGFWQSMSAAKSYRTFLDALYHLTQACAGQQGLRAWISRKWEQAPFRKYLETPPTSAKDRVIMAAVLALVNLMFDDLDNDHKMDVVMLLRRFVIPLELAVDGRRSIMTTALSTQLARLLLHISKSGVADIFPSLIIDSGLAKKLGGFIAGSGISTQSAPLQRALWIDVSIALLDSMKREHLTDKAIQQQLIESITSPLRATAGRHRVPGSFQERDVYVRAAACLAPFDESADEDAVYWRSRLMFDCSSTLRSLGFTLVGWKLAGDGKTEDKHRILRLIVDTMRDDADSDAVRSAAARVLFRFLEGASADTVTLYASSIEAEKLAAQMMRSVAAAVNGASEKCSVRLNLVQVQLLRLFVCQHEKFAGSPLQTMLDPLLVGAADDFKSTRAVVQLLSVSRVFESYQRHCVVFLKMQPGRDAVWWQSILPTALSTIAETARLLQALLQLPMSNLEQMITETPLLLQLIETLTDVSNSLQNLNQHATTDNDATWVHLQRHYEALDECGKLIALVITLSPTSQSLPVDKARKLVQTVTSLLAEENPKRFRLSFARIVAAMFSRPSCSLLTEASSPEVAVSLCTSLWTSYRELSEHQPVDANNYSSRTAPTYLPHLRRVAFALQLVVSRSPEANAVLCADRYGAVQYIVRLLKSGFVAIRMCGGFGAKNPKAAGNETFIADVCASIQLHCQLLSGFFANSSRAQEIARRENLCSVFASNWNVMRAAHRRGSSVLLGALRLLQNYAHHNEANKRSIATTVSTVNRTAAPDSERSLLDMVGDLALGPGSSQATAPFDESWSCTAGAILKSAFLHIDCLHGSIKSGLVTKLFASVVDRSKRYRQTAKPLSKQEELTLIELIGVLASVASSDEGRQVLLQQRELKNLFDDVLHFGAGSDLMIAGSLFLRNMAFSKFSKSHFVVWEPVIDQILSILSSASTDTARRSEALSAMHLSTALVCIAVDNQRAQAVMASSQKTQRRVQDAIRIWLQRADSSEAVSDSRAAPAKSTVSDNLERVQSLLLSNDVESERP